MKFGIDNKIFEAYPEFTDGLCVVKGVDNVKISREIVALLRYSEAKIAAALEDLHAISDHPRVKALRVAHYKFGGNPRKFPSSLESLYRALRRDRQTRSFSNLVNIYNYLSIELGLTAGGEDLDACKGDIRLTYADGTEKFTAIGSSEQNPPIPGEVVYKDDEAVICRRFNWRQSDARKLTPETKNAVLVFEGFSGEVRQDVEKAIAQAAELSRNYCGGTAETYILDKNKREVDIYH